MNYSPVDPIFRAWAEQQGLEVYTNIDGHPEWHEFRNVYLWSKQGECFQIWIDPPESGQVPIHAGDTETRGDEEFRQDWLVALADFSTGLQQARDQVQAWMDR